MLGNSIKQNTLGLGIFAILTAGIIAYTQLATHARIADNIQIAKSKALYEILPEHTHDNVLAEDIIAITDPLLVADEGELEAYVARRGGKAIAVILPTIAPDGYTGKIRSIVGIQADGSIAGVRVLTHQETPGLGDKIEVKKSDWIHQFDTRSLAAPKRGRWAVQKDGGEFDQLTGATITPRAVVRSVLNALDYFEQNKTGLLAPAGKKEKTEQPDTNQGSEQ